MSDFCDWEPCEWLQKLVVQNLDAGSSSSISVTIIARHKRTKPRTLTLWYCPFCGTRIHDNKEIQKWLEDRKA